MDMMTMAGLALFTIFFSIWSAFCLWLGYKMGRAVVIMPPVSAAQYSPVEAPVPPTFSPELISSLKQQFGQSAPPEYPDSAVGPSKPGPEVGA